MLNTTTNEIQASLSFQKKILLDSKQQQDKLQVKLYLLSNEVSILYNAEQQRLQLRGFGYRLALILLLLVISGWLFIKKGTKNIGLLLGDLFSSFTKL